MDDNTETLDMDAKLVGLIIGRQGENLRRIQSDTGTRIQFLDSVDPAVRPCKIAGPKAARDEAKAEITRLIAENNASRGATGYPERPPRSAPDSAIQQGHGEDESSTQIMVPDRTVGLIIGRQGETIKDLQERSGCHVNIEDKAVNSLRPVNLNGNPRSIKRAKDFIMEIVESDARQNGSGGPPQREQRYPGPGAGDTAGMPSDRDSDSVFIPKEAVGMIIGRGMHNTPFPVFLGANKLSQVEMRSKKCRALRGAR